MDKWTCCALPLQAQASRSGSPFSLRGALVILQRLLSSLRVTPRSEGLPSFRI